MSYKQRLELDWIGKDKVNQLEPRILIENESYGSKSENLLIHGDNLLALKALEFDYAKKVKCIYIDIPFNTGQAFEHYDDGMEHSLWLSMMRDRLVILQKLLREDGSIWVHCDDNEQAYLKVVMDEVFGRSSFISTVVWQSRYSRSNDASLSLSHNYIIVFSPNPEKWKTIRNRLTRTKEQADQYKNLDNDPKGPWRAIPWDAPNIRPNLEYAIITPKGTKRYPPEGRHWSRTEDQWKEVVDSGRAFFGKNQDGAPSFKQYLSEASGIVPNTWWEHEDTGNTDEAKKEIHELFGKSNAFSTPKPERLIHRILSIATNPGDIVLDSFLGSGTTAAVAHKMGRKWIGIEMGDHFHSHCIPRIKKVIDGKDNGGISELVEWKGGGGARILQLAPSLLTKDDRGNWIINEQYNSLQLAEAVCKHEKFKFFPHETIYWKQGCSSEKDFIFVTTQFLTSEHLDHIESQMKKGETLLICAKAFKVNKDKHPNITLKKIPQMLLGRCEFGRDDYSLNVKEMVQEELDLN